AVSSTDGARVATIAGDLLYIWDISGRPESPDKARIRFRLPSTPDALVMSDDGHYVGVAGSSAFVFGTEKNLPIASAEPLEPPIAISRSGHNVATGIRGGGFRVLELPSGAWTSTPGGATVAKVLFSPDERLLAVLRRDGFLELRSGDNA